jgi:hypothetical protein
MATTAGPPQNQRRFTNGWGELDYLCKKIRYWLYSRKEEAGATRYVDRLEKVLHNLPKNDLAILREEALAMLAELKGKLADAVVHREREIRLMERLHKEAQSPRYPASTKAYMLQNRDRAALQERRQILEALKKKRRGKVAM